jgi:quinol monooxygenase YgiN
MSEVVVAGPFTAEPGKESEARAALEALVAPTDVESGCVLHAPHRGTDDSRRVPFPERWASREEIDAHLKRPHVSDLLSRVEDLFGDSADIVLYEPLPGGETKKGSPAAHAGA